MSVAKGCLRICTPLSSRAISLSYSTILKLLDKYKMNPLADRKILDVGCGSGGELRRFIEYGASPENLFGIDLLPDRIKRAKELNPLIDFKCDNAE